MSKKAKLVLVLMVIVAILCLAIGTASAEKDKEWVWVCHNGNSLHIPIDALPAHLRHGDTQGFCGDYILYLPAVFKSEFWWGWIMENE